MKEIKNDYRHDYTLNNKGYLKRTIQYYSYATPGGGCIVIVLKGSF